MSAGNVAPAGVYLGRAINQSIAHQLHPVIVAVSSSKRSGSTLCGRADPDRSISIGSSPKMLAERIEEIDFGPKSKTWRAARCAAPTSRRCRMRFSANHAAPDPV